MFGGLGSKVTVFLSLGFRGTQWFLVWGLGFGAQGYIVLGLGV